MNAEKKMTSARKAARYIARPALAEYKCLLFTIFANTTFASSITDGKVYMIIEIEIKDNESYSKYLKKVPPIVKKYGGRYLARGGEITSIAGNWNPVKQSL